ncbi:hypothetical protein HOLleu_43568 [Holothuria leucospilota]|uniref:exodeoxyribonuclease III n=1 Tax=Holothuria leucospilota TaxID=206669 RepID=A0A9Q0YBG5_HOLLE|nr:hypothetical protein HOLleu_43568 [Holothuria leucospilota]
MNVNGLRDKTKCSRITQWCKIVNADIIFLQELFLSTPEDFSFFKKQWGGRVFYSPSLSNHSGGVAIIFSSRVDFKVSQVKHDNFGRCISLCCSVNGSPLKLCNVHAPNPPAERTKFIENLYAYTRWSSPVVLGGDFNCVTNNIDRCSTTQNNSAFVGSTELNRFVAEYLLVDCYGRMHPSSPGHTWSCLNSSSRIDRIYLPREFKITKATSTPFPFSDHNPVIVDFQLPCTPKSKGKGYWKYNVSLNDSDEFCTDLRMNYQLWSSLKEGFYSKLDWWENIKVRIKDLAIRHSVKLARIKRVHSKDLQDRCLHANSEEIERIVNNDIEGACIRSRVKYLEDGDKPSACFFKMEHDQARCKTIQSVRDQNGIVCDKVDDILRIFQDFYKDLYSEQASLNEKAQEMFINSLHKRLGEEEKNSLEQPMTLLDIWNVVSVSAKNKSPGSDGLPYEFYRTFF